MDYEINVSREGRHLFATHERSLDNVTEARKLAREIQKGFPDCKVTLTSYMPRAGTELTFKDLP